MSKTSSKKFDKKTRRISTIKLSEETKKRLGKLRENRRETFEDIIKKILYVLNVLRSDPEKSKRILLRIGEIRTRNLEYEIRQKEEKKKEDKLK